MGGLIIGIILILIGVSALTGISFFNFIVAIVLIMIGIRMVAGRSWHGAWRWNDHPHEHRNNFSSASDEDRIDEVAVFSPLNKSFTSEHFKGGKIVMVFSGGEIDLTQVKMVGVEVDLEISSVFSDIRIIIPKNWKLRTSAAAFLGSVDVQQAQGSSDGDGGDASNSVILNLRGEAAFGNIEVRK